MRRTGCIVGKEGDGVDNTANVEKELKWIAFLHSKRFLVLFAVVWCAFFGVIWVILVRNENHITKMDSDRISLADPAEYRYAAENISWQKDEISVTKDYVQISGWILKSGTGVNSVAIKVGIRDLDTGELSILPTDVIERPDVTEMMNDGNDYNYSGFSVKIPYWDKLDTDTDYELIIQYDLNDDPQVYVPLNATLKKGTMI